MESVEGIPIPVVVAGLRPHDGGPEGALPAGRKPKIMMEKTGPPPSRFSLRLSAYWWRSLERIGMSLHYLARPTPPSPDFVRTVKSTISRTKGEFKIHFYLPKSFKEASSIGIKYPAVINYHGGGFTIGSATDDARFARYVLEKAEAIFISVEYRLAPEHPFPVAVDDGADAILYVITNATELRVDPFNLATSGFSAGGNIAITAPMRLADYAEEHPSSVPDYNLAAIATWYPVTDYTIPRAERRATSVNPDRTLSPMFTNLFDASYLYPPTLNLSDPYLSPTKTSDAALVKAIPPHVLLYTCEYDMLLREGEEFAKRLASQPINKNVHYKMILGVEHGWDKGPNPLRPPDQSEKLYLECCQRLKRIFGGVK
jgi:putative ergosteryl-3beta-O-L-aspartate hydrolase